ncbi:hypothetical protein N7520_009597 [Penicillium odoratum]|uniref:uncharacterized protein n=1 Tax=Penicillium odoratum TaxID=1167516 RepID=UPI0025490514|nr:uncharacterized protein N7520_009597 [Penicillium odoratum]KAJ5752680.1 hypothetical protein N7520_009597 [Penicillium odoratum]
MKSAMHNSAKPSVYVPWAKPAHVRSLPNEECVSPKANNHLPTRCINETPYAKMLREEEEMDFIFNVTVSAANWALLAGYLVVPGTFTSLQSSDQVEHVLQANKAGRTVLHTIQNPPLLSISCCLLLGGLAAFAWLLHFAKLRSNYIWLINRLFTPISLNAAAGLLTTIINVCASQRGDWSVMAIVTTVATGATLIISLALLCFYKFHLLEKIKRDDAVFTFVLPSSRPE